MLALSPGSAKTAHRQTLICGVQCYDLSVAGSPLSPRPTGHETTLMIRNIPNRAKTTRLLEKMDEAGSARHGWAG